MGTILFTMFPLRRLLLQRHPALTTKIQELAKQLSDTLTAAMASGEINDTWRTVEGMSFRDAIQILQLEANFPSE